MDLIHDTHSAGRSKVTMVIGQERPLEEYEKMFTGVSGMCLAHPPPY